MVPRPIGPAAICRAGKIEGEGRRYGLPARHGGRAVVYEVTQADAGRHLSTVLLVRRLEQGIPQTGGHGQVRFPVPSILEIPVGLPRAEISVDEGALWKDGSGLIAIVARGYLVDDSHQVHNRVVVDRGVIWVNLGKPEGHRI